MTGSVTQTEFYIQCLSKYLGLEPCVSALRTLLIHILQLNHLASLYEVFPSSSFHVDDHAMTLYKTRILLWIFYHHLSYTVIIIPGQTVVERDNTVSFTCIYDANPSASPIWYGPDGTVVPVVSAGMS